MFKKLLCLALCVFMLLPVFAGCGSDPDDVGQTLNLTLAEPVYDLDPAYAYRSESAMQLAKMMFATLFSVDDNGKLKNTKTDLVKKYKIEDDDEQGIYRITLTLRETMWTDGSAVSAKDVLFAWTRILKPTMISDAAVLLYDIKNAYAAKNGDCSVDEIGVIAIDEETLQIDFEQPINYKAFLLNLANPCLAPLKKSSVDTSVDWSKDPATIVCSGPFTLREFTPDKTLVLERNSYYFRDREKDDIKKSVTPYRLNFNLEMTAEEQLAAYKDGTLDAIANIPLESRKDYKKDATLANALSTTAYYFNVNNELFANADVRRALSVAIDREAIAEMLVYAEAATGFVPTGVFEANKKNAKFRDKGGDLISASANIEEAKNILSDAGVKASGQKFSITVRNTEADLAVAEAVKASWEELGFKINIVKRDSWKAGRDYLADGISAMIESGSFDVLAIDVKSLGTSAFNLLAPFATGYTCQDMIFNTDGYVDAVNLSGYVSEEYDALINEAFAEKDLKKRATILHKAEELLLKDMPVVPVVFNKTVILTDDVKGIDADYFGLFNFNDAKIK